MAVTWNSGNWVVGRRGAGKRDLAQGRLGNRTGGCCGCGNVDRNGRCFRAGSRRCYGRRHESRCGSRTGGCSGTRTGCGSGCRYGAGTRCCWGASTGGRCEGRAWGRSVGCCSGRNGCGFRRRCGGRTEGRLGGRNSPSRLGDGKTGWQAKSEVRSQMLEVRSAGGGIRFTVYGARLQGERCTKKRTMLRFGVVVPLIPLIGLGAPGRVSYVSPSGGRWPHSWASGWPGSRPNS